jgi:photosystem II stability/assembly factor-like uncharacterized protein
VPISGRVNAVAFDPTNFGTIYLGAPNGGVWKTTDSGATWLPLADGWPSLAVSSIAVDPLNSKNVYAGTGDIPGGFGPGIGVMKSVDGGANWLVAGLSGTAVSSVICDPDFAGLVMAAEWGGSLWRSSDFGLTWKAVSGPPGGTAWTGIVFGALSTSKARLYYAIGEGVGAQLWRSSDKGQSWQQLSTPLQKIAQGRPLVAASPIFPENVYLFSPTDQKIFASEDAGVTWRDITLSWKTEGQVAYNYCITCSHIDKPGAVADVLYIGEFYVWQLMTNGGNWTLIEGNYPTGHSDQHAIAVDPFSPSAILVGNDGGVYYITGYGTSVIPLNSSLGITQIYVADCSVLDRDSVIVGAQDIGTCIPGVDLNNWIAVGGGDGGSCLIQPFNADFQFLMDNFGNSQRQLRRTSDRWQNVDTSIAPSQATPGIGNEPTAVNSPLIFDPSQPWLVYLATNYLYRWTDTGGSNQNQGSWEAHVGNQQLSANNLVYALAVAQSDSKRIYSGAGDGELWMSTNAGSAGSWRRIDSGLPKAGVSALAVNSTNPDDVIVTFWTPDDASISHVWRCYDASSANPSWVDVTGAGGPSALPPGRVNTVARDAFDPEKIWFVGTDAGVFFTNDAGATSYNATRPFGLPNVPVFSLKQSFITGYLYAGTYGRGLWRARLLPLNVPCKIVSKASGKVFDVPGFATADGVLIQQYQDNGGTNQQWRLVPVQGGFVRIQSLSSGKVLDVPGFATNDGVAIQQYTDNGGTNQQWNLVPRPGGSFQIFSRSSGQVLEAIPGANHIQQFGNSTRIDQQFDLVPTP